MTTTTEAREAPTLCRQQRFGLRGLLRVNEQLASPEDLDLIAKVRAVKTAEEYDRALGDKKVCALFLRGTLYFGEQR